MRKIDLTKDPILPSLAGLALPIMATSLIQMAYNLIDMLWIGRIGSAAVAAIGAAGMYMWLSNGLATLAKMGGQVKVAHALGAKREEEAAEYAQSALQLSLIFGIGFGLISVVAATPMISFFKLNSAVVIADAEIYLQITCGGVVFSFLNQVFTGVLTAMGNSRVTFVATTIGLVFNIVLDPALIFGLGPLPAMGVVGAALATVFSQVIVTAIFVVIAYKDRVVFRKIHLLKSFHKESMAQIIRIGFPIGVQSMFFTAISMIIARMVAGFGDAAVAVQKVGSQIESISWMTAEGFGAAVSAFMAQNLGAGSKERIIKGYRVAIGLEIVWGILCTVLLIVFPDYIFKIFITEKEILPMGVDYLKILGVAQFFMCIELTTAGAFTGLGKTIPPSITSIVLSAVRIPIASMLVAGGMGLNGIWWSITISCILKGIVMFVWFLYYLKHDFKRYFSSGMQKL